MSPVVHLEDVHVRYPGGMHALRGVDLRLDPGAMVAVIGESGCGKTTLGKVCLGLQPPTAGRVLYGDRDVFAPGFRWTLELRSQVQVVHQDPFSSLNPVRTVLQSLAAPIRHHGLARSEAQARGAVADLLAQVGLEPPEEFLGKYPFQLSGGQKQRVALARAVLLQPRLIVADEPVSAVDAPLRRSILDLMRSLNEQRGMAFLYITHDLATARYFAGGGTLLVMYLGAVVESGPLQECLDQPAHPYLRALLAAIPTTDLRRVKERRELPVVGVDVTAPASGCAFHPRCPRADDLCRREAPVLAPVRSDAHRAACHHPL